MKRILYISSTANKRERLDGETIKCRLLEEFFKKNTSYMVKSVDTDNWQKNKMRLAVSIILKLFWCNCIIISSADRGANIILSFLDKIKYKKDIYYFVVGGRLYENILNNKWNYLIYKRIKKVYVESNLLKANLEKIGIDNVKVLNNFRKIENFNSKYIIEKNIKFVFYGRVIKDKGIEEAINLIKKLNKQKYQCKLDIYGQVEEEYLKEIEKKFDNNIRYKGVIKPNNKTEYEILSQYDIFIFPTEYAGECLPGALIDAYIAGLAVIASNWKYAKEYIVDGKNGIIFKYKDYQDMYNKTIKMIDDNKINDYKKESKAMSKKYLIENVLEELVEELKED